MPESASPSTTRAETLSRMLVSADGRRSLADELERVLFRDALDAHWPATEDGDCGGFLTDLDRRWRPAGPQTKSLEFMARESWAFARAAGLYPGRGYDKAARQGFDFLTERMWDRDHGGFYTLVDRGGSPLEHGRKHPHGHLYAIEAFIALAPLIGETEARLWACRTMDWLETAAWDPVGGGYWGYYHRDNRRITPAEAAIDWIASPIGWKDLNVATDAIATLDSLAASGWDARARARLDWYVALYLDRLCGLYDVIPYNYFADWSVAPDIPRSGQPLQLIASLLGATARTGRFTEARAACATITQNTRRFFAHDDGGYCFARSINKWPLLGVDLTVAERTWWVQLEAGRGWLLLALLDADDPTPRSAFARQWAFIERRLIDPRFRGLFQSVEDATVARRWSARPHKTNVWKDVSHEAHFLMDAVEWLRKGARECLLATST